MSDSYRADAATSEEQSRGQDLRQRALEAYDSARVSASGATRKAGDALVEAPLVALAAGLAAGALIAALLPVSRREKEMLGPVGDRVGNAARGAVQTAREVGSDKLRELGLAPDNLVEKATEAARATAEAAVGTFKESAGKEGAGNR